MPNYSRKTQFYSTTIYKNTKQNFHHTTEQFPTHRNDTRHNKLAKINVLLGNRAHSKHNNTTHHKLIYLTFAPYRMAPIRFKTAHYIINASAKQANFDTQTKFSWHRLCTVKLIQMLSITAHNEYVIINKNV